MNAHMADLRRCFDSAGFSNVTTVLASGNVVFDARSAGNATLERKAEVAMARAGPRARRASARPARIWLYSRAASALVIEGSEPRMTRPTGS